MFKMTSYGASMGVTGSKHIIEVGGKKIMLDCGMFQGKRKIADELNRNFGFDVKSLDAIIISHAHIDHCGLLPKIVKDGYSGPIYCNNATRDLVELMLIDSAHIQESDFGYFAKHQEFNGLEEEEPLYTSEDIQPVFDKIIVKKIYDEFMIGDVKIKFFIAGHILGASMILLEYKGKKLLFTGDLGRENVPIIKDPDHPEADFVIMESTYGGKTHDPIEMNRVMLSKVINETVKKGGKIIIPSFVVERTQEILYYIEEAIRKHEIKPINIYVDSPLAIKVTDIFKKHADFYDEDMKKIYEASIPFQERNIIYTNTVEDSKKLNYLKLPCIIISASGMIEAGRIRHHIVNNIGDKRNTILIVGYMAEDTLGRKLIEKEPEVNILGKRYKVEAEVSKINGFSGHADERELLVWLTKLPKLPKKIVLVHGEKTGLDAMQEKISNMGIDTEISMIGKSIILE